MTGSARACFGWVLAGVCVAANAREARTSFTVSATVNPMARIEQQSEPAQIEITAADLRRGYLDVPLPTTLLVRSNSPSGFALDLQTIVPMLESVIVHGLAGDQSLGAEGGSIVQRWRDGETSRGAQSRSLSLRFRLVLLPGLQAGTYPWPVRMAVRPLDQ
jgi:hypothetical protein